MSTDSNIPAVGIDLGTTFSVICKLDETGAPSTLVNAEGDRITPSVVLFDGEEVIVGREALKGFATEAEKVAECSKRDMGYRVFHKVLENKQYPPEVIEAFILNKLRLDAQSQIGSFSKVVITVPAYFDEVRRKATQDAGYIAGFEVLDIINEPTAAALAFSFQHGYMDGSNGNKSERILVYDLGGGTFDVTVMEVRGNECVALSTDGDVRLGGWDWDQRLVDLVAEGFIRQFYVDPREDPRTAGKLWRECEEAKRTLSARQKATVPCDYRGFSGQIEVTRQQFEEATQDLLDRTRFTSCQALKAANLEWDGIDRILLVGGSTRMPMVKAMIKQISGKEADASVAADEAVAQGAAIHAGHMLAKAQGQPQSYTIKNVNSHSLGVVGTDPLTRRKRNGILIPRNTTLPVTAKRTFRTQRAQQRSILVQVVEGESASPDDCTHIGRCTVSKLPADLPVGSPIDVLFHYQPDGRLKVRVSLPNTDTQVETEFARENSLSKEHLDGWRRYISGSEPTDYT
jgi:molecular chaperone DnaK